MPVTERIAAARTGLTRRWKVITRRRPGIAHAVRAYQHYKRYHGDHLAAAITYFSFLALFPLILLGVSVAGFVLASNQKLQAELFASITRNLPGAFGTTVQDAITAAVNHRTSVGVIGVVGFALAGLGWIANLRTAIDTVWGIPAATRSMVWAKLTDAVVLIGLGIGIVLSLGLTAGGTAASGAVLTQFGLQNLSGGAVFTSVLGILLGIGGSMIIFGWLIVRLPDVDVPRRTAIRTSLLAAVGFEILKLIGTYYIALVSRSPAGAVLGSVVGILVWMDLVARFLLYCVAWAATAGVGSLPAGERTQLEADGPQPADAEPRDFVSPLGVATALFSAGAAFGAAAAAALSRRRRAPQRDRQPIR